MALKIQIINIPFFQKRFSFIAENQEYENIF